MERGRATNEKIEEKGEKARNAAVRGDYMQKDKEVIRINGYLPTTEK